MATVIDVCSQRPTEVVTVCDFSPPRGPDRAVLEQARLLDADFICVAYNPGKAVRADSALLAAAIQEMSGRSAIFNLSPRDMNQLALQSHLVGASLHGLQNVVVLQGDSFTEKEQALVHAVNEVKPTGLVRAIKALNNGTDFKGQKLAMPTAFCVGATLDLGKGVASEALLAHKKVQAGADFFLAQPVYDLSKAESFYRQYRSVSGDELTLPVFWGLQVLEKGGLAFGDLPDVTRQELEQGRPGPEIALELLGRFRASGIRAIYLVPPILRGGARNYAAAQQVLATLKR